MAGNWSGPPAERGASRYRTGRDGYQTGNVYGSRPDDYDEPWEYQRRPAYAEDSRQARDYYDGGPDADDGGWAHDRYDGGYGDGGYPDARQRSAQRRRARAEAALRAQADAEADAIAAAAADYGPHAIVTTGRRRRQLVLASLLGSAVTLVGERVLRAFGHGGSANAATNQQGMTNGTGGARSTAPTPAGQAGTATTTRVVLGATTDVPVGSAKIYATHKIVVTQPTAGTFKAYSTICTHAGCLLDQVKADKIYCPCHAGVFNLDGSVASGPPPNSLPARHITVTNGQITL